MPLRTAKPYYKVDSSGEAYVITHYRTNGSRKFRGASIVIPKGDPVAFRQEVQEWIDSIPGRRVRQEK